MSENLFHNEPVPSKEIGWSRMEALLDDNMPLQEKCSQVSRWWQSVAAALLVGVLLCATLQTSDSVVHSGFTKHVLPQHQVGGNEAVARTTMNKESFHQSDVKRSNLLHAKSEMALPVNNEALRSKFELPENGRLATAGFLSGKLTLIRSSGKVIEPPEALDRLLVTTLSNRNQRTHSWDISVGVGQNFNLRGTNRLNLFPVAELSYHVSNKFLLKAVVELFSIVQTNAKSIDKTVYVNDSLNNIRLVNETTSYNQLNYLNFPVSASLSLSKNFSVETGVQASLLVSTNKQTGIEAYDYQMNRLNAPTYGPPLITAAPPVHQVASTPREVDYRLLAGLRYTTGKTSLALQYQHGLTTMLPGRNVNNGPTRLLTLKLLYKIK